MTYIDCEKARRKYIAKLMDMDIESLTEMQKGMDKFDRDLLLVLTEKANALEMMITEDDMVDALWMYAGIDVRKGE